MSDFIQQALKLSPQGQPWLAGLKQQGEQVWGAAAMPTRKTEAWKYTRLRPLEAGNYLARPQPVEIGSALARSYRIGGLDALQLVFVNGRYQAELSAGDLPTGLEMVHFSGASKEQARLISQHLGSLVDRQQHLFAALNDSWLEDGLLLRIKAGAHIDKPIQIVWLTTAQDQGFSTAQRLLVLVEPGAAATLIEHFVSDAKPQNCFTNGLTELLVQADAKLTHYRLNLEQEQALHIGGVHVSLAERARLNSFCLALGGALKRVDYVVHHRGAGAHCDLNGVYLGRNDQHVDFHTSIEHEVPNCTTDEIFRGIVGDRAQAVFNGRIHIHPQAQKTAAYLSNKNLLTSNEAEVDTKPELEIYANDVQCAHGATVSQLDEQLLYYFMSRGIGRRKAELMLSFAFINELLGRLEHRQIGDFLRPMLTAHFVAGSQKPNGQKGSAAA